MGGQNKLTRKKGLRKKGEWKNIAQSRNHGSRALVTNPGAFQLPHVGDVGSAAYRRLMASRKTSKRNRAD